MNDGVKINFRKLTDEADSAVDFCSRCAESDRAGRVLVETVESESIAMQSLSCLRNIHASMTG